MANITLHGARHDLSQLKIGLKRFETFCSVEIRAGDDTVALFIDGNHADRVQVLVDLIKDNLEQTQIESVLDPV